MNPLDLFSENQQTNLSSNIRKDDEVDEDEKELIEQSKLIKVNDELKNTRIDLLKDVENLENQLIDLVNSSNEDNKKEDELIFELLLNKAEKQNDEVSKDDDNNEEYDKILNRYSALPSTNWDERLTFLKLVYPFITISDSESHFKFIDSQLNKIISFKLNSEKNYYKLDIKIFLLKTQNSYSINDIQIERLSSNKYNSILKSLITYYTQTKNINEFLNKLAELYQIIEQEKTRSDTTSHSIILFKEEKLLVIHA